LSYTTAELIGLVQDAALRYGIDPNIAVAQLDLESVHFRPLYVYGPGTSPAGAMGIAQFMPGTWSTYGNGSPFDPVAALDAWGRYMSHLLSAFGGRYDLALAGYNWGENRSSLRQALSTGQSVLAYSIPSETRNYVQTILNAAPSAVASSGNNNTFDNFFGIPVDDGTEVPPKSDGYQFFDLNTYLSSPNPFDEPQGGGISAGVIILGVVAALLLL
jgi:hypothetical protein